MDCFVSCHHAPSEASPCGNAWAWSYSFRYPHRYPKTEKARSPRFLGDPHLHLPCSQTPVRPFVQGRYCASVPLPLMKSRKLSQRYFGAQSHGFYSSCLRFTHRVASCACKTRFRLLTRLYRAGLTTRRITPKGFGFWFLPPSQAFPGAIHRTFDSAFKAPALGWRTLIPEDKYRFLDVSRRKEGAQHFRDLFPRKDIILRLKLNRDRCRAGGPSAGGFGGGYGAGARPRRCCLRTR